VPPRPHDAIEFSRVLARVSAALSAPEYTDARRAVEEASARNLYDRLYGGRSQPGWEHTAATLNDLLGSGAAAAVGVEEDVKYALGWVRWVERGYRRDPHQAEKRAAKQRG
jgi:hypothetical protein